MENGIVSKVSLRTSQTRKYNRIYVMIKVWGSLGSIKSIHRVMVSTPLTSNAPSVASVTVLSRLMEDPPDLRDDLIGKEKRGRKRK